MKSKLGQNTLYNMVYQIISVLVPLITSPYLSRVIGADGIGKYAVTNSIANYFFIFAMLGVNNYGNRSIAQSKCNKLSLSHTFWQIYYLQVICSFVVLILYGVYCVLFSSREMLGMYVAQGIFVFSAVTDINWFAFGMERFKTITIRNIIVKIITTVLIFVCVKTPDDVEMYTVIVHMGTVMGLLIVWPMVIKETNIERPYMSEVVKHLKPNVKLFIPYVASSLYHGMDKVMLGMLASNASVGYYTYSLNILNIPLGIITAISTVFMPRITYLIQNNQAKSASLLFEKSFFYISIMTIAMSWGILAIAPIFIPFYLGESYQKTAEMLGILAITIIISGMESVLNTMYLIPNEKDNIYIVSTIVGTVVNLLGDLIVIPLCGGYGACWATVIAKISSLAVEIGMTFTEIPYVAWIRRLIPYMLLGGAMYSIVSNMRNIDGHPLSIIMAMVTIGILFYIGGVLIGLVFVEKDEFIINMIKKVRK